MSDDRDVYITISHGLNNWSIEKIHEIEKALYRSLDEVGFNRIESSKSGDSCTFTYDQMDKHRGKG